MNPPSRRALLTTVPVALASTLTSPASATSAGEGVEVVAGWKPLTLRAGVTPFPGDAPQARAVRIAGTTFLQLRGGASVAFTADAVLGMLPAGLAVPKLTRGLCPRNNLNGLIVCRVEADTKGQLTVLGGTAAGKITWVALDGFSSVLA
ncbi:hypothetical protein [Nonomuraea sediminis]|uniref:hypothetical protein n=1 Tax=Nonomuraea sediminis TaxID=2835864 RepID=UPI001BDC635D|nr:hypothetical protein [Nonomuraea sediminis]